MDTVVVCPQCEAANRVDLAHAASAKPSCGRCKSELPIHGGVQELSGTTLGLLLKKTSKPVIVDFWAQWCVPCRAFAPIYEKVARLMSDRFVFTKLDTGTHPLAGSAYQVRGVPTLIVFQNGQELDRQTGAMNEPMFTQYLQRWNREEAA